MQPGKERKSDVVVLVTALEQNGSGGFVFVLILQYWFHIFSSFLGSFLARYK